LNACLSAPPNNSFHLTARLRAFSRFFLSLTSDAIRGRQVNSCGRLPSNVQQKENRNGKNTFPLAKRGACHNRCCCVSIRRANVKVAAQNNLKVGDRIHRPNSSPTYDDKGTVMEIGTGRNEGCQLVLWDKVKRHDPDHKGNWMCTYGVKGNVFLIDANGKRIRDINEPGEANTETGETPPAAAPCSGEPLVNLKTEGARTFRRTLPRSYRSAARRSAQQKQSEDGYYDCEP